MASQRHTVETESRVIHVEQRPQYVLTVETDTRIENVIKGDTP